LEIVTIVLWAAPPPPPPPPPPIPEPERLTEKASVVVFPLFVTPGMGKSGWIGTDGHAWREGGKRIGVGSVDGRIKIIS